MIARGFYIAYFTTDALSIYVMHIQSAVTFYLIPFSVLVSIINNHS